MKKNKSTNPVKRGTSFVLIAFILINLVYSHGPFSYIGASTTEDLEVRVKNNVTMFYPGQTYEFEVVDDLNEYEDSEITWSLDEETVENERASMDPEGRLSVSIYDKAGSVLTNGTNITIYAKLEGNTEKEGEITIEVSVDTAVPEVDYTIQETDGKLSVNGKDWYTGSVFIHAEGDWEISQNGKVWSDSLEVFETVTEAVYLLRKKNGEGFSTANISLNIDNTVPWIEPVDVEENNYIGEGGRTFTFQVTDAESGVKEAYYAYFGEGTTPTGQDFEDEKIAMEGKGGKCVFTLEDDSKGNKGMIYVWAVDEVGNKSSKTDFLYIFDKKAPEISPNSVSDYRGKEEQTYRFTVTDEDSGVDNVYYALKEDQSQESLETYLKNNKHAMEKDGDEYIFTVDPDIFDGKIYIWAVDKVGNQSERIAFHYYIDRIAPSISPKQIEDYEGNEKKNYNFSITDEGSGVDKAYYAYYEGNVLSPEELEEFLKEDGNQNELDPLGNNRYRFKMDAEGFNGTIYVWAVDKLGNQSDIVSFQYQMDGKEYIPHMKFIQVGEDGLEKEMEETEGQEVCYVNQGKGVRVDLGTNHTGKANISIRYLVNGQKINSIENNTKWYDYSKWDGMISDEGIYYVYAEFSKYFNANNKFELKYLASPKIVIDRTAPEFTGLKDYKGNEKNTFTFEVRDGVSGVKEVYYKYYEEGYTGEITEGIPMDAKKCSNNGNKYQFDTELDYMKGRYYVWAKDHAGNVEETSVEVYLDARPCNGNIKLNRMVDGKVEGNWNTWNDSSASADVLYFNQKNASLLLDVNVNLDDVKMYYGVNTTDTGQFIEFDKEGGNPVTLYDEGSYVVTVKFVKGVLDINHKDVVTITTPRIVIDRTSPSNVKITYDRDPIQVVNEEEYYKQAVTVTLSAEDDISGIKEFRFQYGANVKVIGAERKTDGGYKADFTIQPGFSGEVKAAAVDFAGNGSTEVIREKRLVVDDTAPILKVSKNQPIHSKDGVGYYNNNVVFALEVTESNFYKEDVEVKVSKNGTLVGVNHVVWNGRKAEFALQEDGLYQVAIEYKDRSGNGAIPYQSEEMAVDKTNPVVKVTFDKDKPVQTNNGREYYKSSRTATIQITEQNFLQELVDVSIAAKDAKGGKVDYETDLTELEWTSQGSVHTARIDFIKDANYDFHVVCTDIVNRNSNDNNHFFFTIDGKGAETVQIKVTSTDTNGKGISWITDKFLKKVSFGQFSSKSATVLITANDAISGLQKIEYLKVTSSMELDELKNSTGWQEYKGKFKVKANEQFVIYARAWDYSGNATYFNTNGIILDKKEPKTEVDKKEPLINLKENGKTKGGIYNSNVRVGVTIHDDPDGTQIYSGLKSVTYKVRAKLNGKWKTTQERTYTFEKENPLKKDLKKAFKKNILVNAKLNDSNQVRVVVSAVDNAGNRSSGRLKLAIDRTNPVVEVEYDNDDVKNQTYFQGQRTAKVTITERNFNASDVKMEIVNRDGSAIPLVGDWTHETDANNPDGDTHSVDVSFREQGDYQFSVSYTDKAGNKAKEVNYNGEAPQEFVVDTDKPELGLEFDNNEVKNQLYYKEKRTAVITLKERYRDKDLTDGSIVLTARDSKGNPLDPPSINIIENGGDVQKAAITFHETGHYGISAKYTDKSGQESNEIDKISFYISMDAPEIIFSGVKDGNSYKEASIEPIVSINEEYLYASSVRIHLKGTNTNLNKTYKDVKDGMFKVTDFINKRGGDDIYTLSVSASDMAGNHAMKSIDFSVNRNGSVFTLPDQTKQMVERYYNNSGGIVEIFETNVDGLHNIPNLENVTAEQVQEAVKVILSRENTNIDLKYGQDYTIETVENETSGGWKQYVYRIFEENFTQDGNYSVKIITTDKVKNISDNTDEKKAAEIKFAVDKTAPKWVFLNIEDGKDYKRDGMVGQIEVVDSSGIEELKLYVLGRKGELGKEAELNLLEDGKTYTFEIPASNSKQNISLYAKDKAGNEIQTQDASINILVTTDELARFYNNKLLFYGFIAMSISIMAFVAGIIIYRKRVKR